MSLIIILFSFIKYTSLTVQNYFAINMQLNTIIILFTFIIYQDEIKLYLN